MQSDEDVAVSLAVLHLLAGHEVGLEDQLRSVVDSSIDLDSLIQRARSELQEL